jgi:hypothetical protein
MTALFWIAYVVAVGAFLASAWKRIGEWDRAHDELERRRPK